MSHQQTLVTLLLLEMSKPKKILSDEQELERLKRKRFLSNEAVKRYKLRFPERARASQRKTEIKWREKNKDLIKERYHAKYRDVNINWKLQKRYGITIDDYNEMFSNQKGCCKICERHQSMLSKKLRVDHCHATGKVRGLLCDACNVSLGLFKENINTLKNAINYLKEN